MAKRRQAAPARPGQRQLFPESLQDQRQITMQVLVPAETARTIAAEQARRDRAKVAPNGRRRRRAKAACNCPPAANPKRQRAAPKRARANAGKLRWKSGGALHPPGTKVLRVAAVVTLTRKELQVWKTSPGGRLKLMAAARKIAKRHGGRAYVYAPGGREKLAEIG